MTYTFTRLRNKNGVRVQKPVGVHGAILDIDKDRRAFVFSGAERGAKTLGELRVMEFEAHAQGLFLRGYEPVRSGDEQVMYQEWFLAYEVHESEEKRTV